MAEEEIAVSRSSLLAFTISRFQAIYLFFHLIIFNFVSMLNMDMT